MFETDCSMARRSLIKGVGLGIGAGMVADLARTSASAAPATPEIWSADYWARKGEVSLYLHRKRLGTPAAGDPALPVLFLVHGSSASSRPAFHLTLPRHRQFFVL